MANHLNLRDRNGYPWGKFTIRVHWVGGGSDSVWINESGIGEFKGSGVVSYVSAAGEEIGVGKRVHGDTTIVVVSSKAH